MVLDKLLSCVKSTVSVSFLSFESHEHGAQLIIPAPRPN